VNGHHHHRQKLVSDPNRVSLKVNSNHGRLNLNEKQIHYILIRPSKQNLRGSTSWRFPNSLFLTLTLSVQSFFHSCWGLSLENCCNKRAMMNSLEKRTMVYDGGDVCHLVS